jgi:hypothetical protein
MPISELELLRKALYRRSGGQCECTRDGCSTHKAKSRCTRILYGDGWKIMRLRRRGPENLRNVFGMCLDCHKAQTMPRL